MRTIRSVLWIGPGRGLAENGVTEEALLDLVWVRDTDDALSLPMGDFDVVVLAHHERELQAASLRRFAQKPGSPPRLVLSRSQDVDALRELMAVDTGEVVILGKDLGGDGESATLGADAHMRLPGNGVRHPADSPDLAWRRMLVETIDRLARARGQLSLDLRRRNDGGSPSAHPGVIGPSDAIRSILDLVDKAARGTTSVLLNGETGTGKEVFARAIHRSSDRAHEAFIAINCAALCDSLLESELFGHVRGAFTGASSTKAGLFELATGGTLFLDEIGETTPALQAKLLRALQDKEIRPVGGSHSRKIDVRIISASNRDLRQEAGRGAFREDLFYRLAVFPISIPPLRQRWDDIVPLARHFLSLYGEAAGAPACELSQPAAELLVTYTWPGNVRELENEMQRALALAEPGSLITPELLSDQIKSTVAPTDTVVESGETLREVVAKVEALVIRRTLANNGGRRAVTARHLGMTREGLYKKMKKLGVQ